MLIMRNFRLSILILIILGGLWSCQKEYSLEGSLIKLPAGTWQFNDSSKLFAGNMDTAYVDTSAPTKVLHLLGTSAVGNATFSMQLFSVDSFKLGIYHVLSSESEFQYFSPTTTIYQTGILTGEFIVTITQLANNHITGIFSGLTADSAGNSKQITLGKFSSAIKLKSSALNTNAAGTLGTSAGNCTPVTTSGIFTQGTVLDPSNTVQVQVTVARAGTYTISTNSINGVTFSKSGLFSSTGIQNVILTGTGTPVNSGVQNFTVTFGGSVCNFSINFLTGTPPPPVLDYFPLTLNSNWIYYFTTVPFDSISRKVISYNPTFSGNSYSSFQSNTIPPGSPIDTGYFRKLGSDYFQYSDLSSYFGFTNPTFGENIFLKDNVIQGSTWQSQNFTGNITGIPGNVVGYISMTLLAKAVAVTIGTQNFPDVMKVKYDYYISIMPGTPIATEEKWFARGVGLIHHNLDNGQSVMDVNRYTIF